MTEQSITVTKIEPAGATPDWWRIYIIDGAYFTRNTEEARALGFLRYGIDTWNGEQQ